MADGRYSTLTRLGFGALAFNSAGDAARRAVFGGRPCSERSAANEPRTETGRRRVGPQTSHVSSTMEPRFSAGARSSREGRARSPIGAHAGRNDTAVSARAGRRAGAARTQLSGQCGQRRGEGGSGGKAARRALRQRVARPGRSGRMQRKGVWVPVKYVERYSLCPILFARLQFKKNPTITGSMTLLDR
ncbi:hypothetical protein PVAP13_4NG052100 [Panicum virgatum]|uniref:Uncharacterized protein n=1 Tax=Panicum virgatum TaxID=38727 RepID=A0A8T0SXE1_PANVG|nr:hypothetical protein PVAP13_4NG052100 [Panicum virgatum]